LSNVNYLGGGYVLGDYASNVEENPNFYTGYFAIFNPTKRNAKTSITVYYEDRGKSVIENIDVLAETNKIIHWEECQEIERGKRWGAKITSTEPVVVQETLLVYTPEGWAEPYKIDYWPKLDRIPNDMDTANASPILSKEWHHGDGNNILTTPRMPFNVRSVGLNARRLYEPEFVAFLNPNDKDAEVTMTAYYSDQTKTVRKFKVSAESYKWVPFTGEVISNKPFGTNFISTEPVLVYIHRIVHDILSPVQRAMFCMTAQSTPPSRINYFAGPKSKLWLFNPNNSDADVTITYYFENHEPTHVKVVQRAESTNAHLDYMSKSNPELFKEDVWGTKLESDKPIFVQGIHATFGPEDMAVIGQLTTSMSSYMAVTDLSDCWYHADGIVVVPPTDLSKKFYAPQFVYVLNPTKKDTDVVMTAYYSDKTKSEYKFKVPADRVKTLQLEKIVALNKHFGARLKSTQPIAVQFERKGFVKGDPLQRASASAPAIPCSSSAGKSRK